MRYSLAVMLGIIGGVCGVTTRAAADEPLPIYPAGENRDSVSGVENDEVKRPRFDDHPFVVQLRTGVAAATGLVGVVIEYNLHDRFAVDVGVGTNVLGVSNSLGARARPVVFATENRKQLHALVLETSIARSAYQGTVLCFDRCSSSKYVGWAQGEVGWEARFGRWQVQTSLGAALLLDDDQFDCAQSSSSGCKSGTASQRALFSQTFGVGYAF